MPYMTIINLGIIMIVNLIKLIKTIYLSYQLEN